MSKVQQFKDLAERYGFKVQQDGNAYCLCAKNTDNEWTEWISYYPDEDVVSFRGNTDNLNIWLCDTRKDFVPVTCLQFVDDLNDLFELKGSDKFLVRELIDPEDWQEIAGVPDASEDKRYSQGHDMNVLIYKADSSKLVKIGEEGYLPGQEQAKTYFDSIPRGEFTVAITGKEQINHIASMAHLELRGNNRVLISVNNEDVEHIGLTIYCFDESAGRATHHTVSYAHCDAESNYPLANEILEFIEETFNKERAQMSIDAVLSGATERSAEQRAGTRDAVEMEKG